MARSPIYALPAHYRVTLAANPYFLTPTVAKKATATIQYTAFVF